MFQWSQEFCKFLAFNLAFQKSFSITRSLFFTEGQMWLQKLFQPFVYKKNPFDSHENWEFWYFDKDLSTIYTNVFQGQFYVRYHHPLLQWVQIKSKWTFLIWFWSIFYKNFHQLWYFDSINNSWKWRSMKINCYFRINFNLVWCLLWQIESLFELDR